MKTLIDAIRNHCIRASEEIADILLIPGKRIKIDSTSLNQALNLAVIFNNFEAVKILLEHGADVNNPYEFTPLLFKTDNIKILKILIENGENVNRINIFGKSRLLAAMRDKHYNIAKLLVDNNAIIKPLSEYHQQYYKQLSLYCTHTNLFNLTVVLPTLPTYVIMWICDWINLGSVSEYQKVTMIERFKRSIEKLKR